VIGWARVLPLAIALGVPLLGAGQAGQVRDAGSQPSIGTASVSGVVVDDQERSQPVRRAVVTLTGAGLRPNRGAITDDEGRFTISGLPEGRFTLTAERGAYVTSIYGAKRPGRAGTEIIVKDGQRVVDLRVRLWRGAAIAGMVRDEFGDPLPSASVTAIPIREVTPATLTLSNNTQVATNDAGEFRIFGLEPGTYLIRATSALAGRAEVAVSEADVDAKLAALAARGSRTAPTSVSPASAAAAPSQLVQLVPVFYPGTSAIAEAVAITLKAGEERAGLDFAYRRVAASGLRGTIIGAGGAPSPRAFVRLAPVSGANDVAGAVPAPITATSANDGTFSMMSLSPGRYALLVRGIAPGANESSGPFWWTEAPVSLAGGDVDLGALSLRPGMTVTGRVVFDGVVGASDTTGLKVQVQSASLGQQPTSGRGGSIPGMRYLLPAPVGAEGAFRVGDLIPEEYQVAVTGPAVESGRWWLRSAMWNNRDLLDSPFRIEPGIDLAGVTLVLSSARPELSGSITAASGAGVPGLFVLAFPAEATLRVPRSRRIQAVRPDSGGRYVFSNLPPGNYLVAAMTDIDPGDWDVPGFLDAVVSAAAKVTLGEGEKKTLNLRVGG